MNVILILVLVLCAYFFFSTYFKIQIEKSSSFFDYLLLSIYFSGCICLTIDIALNNLRLS